MLELRIIATPQLAPAALKLLNHMEIVTDVVHLPNAACKPTGDFIMCHVPKESGSEVVDALRALGIDSEGSISLSTTVVVISPRADMCCELAAGTGSDAVIWQSVQSEVEEQARLSTTYLAFICIAGLLATIALLTDSLVLVIGAMVVGPEFGPIAALCVAVATRNRLLARKSFVIVVIGFVAAILLSYLTVELLIVAGVAPTSWNPSQHILTAFVAKPDVYSGLVAALAGIAGMLSLTTAHSGVMVGVFISVTTIPAAGNMALAAAYSNWQDVKGSAAQLAINVGVILVAGTLTLLLQRQRYAQRFDRLLQRLPTVLAGKKRD